LYHLIYNLSIYVIAINPRVQYTTFL